VVTADRGFNISDDLAVIGAHLEIPASTRVKKQLSMSEVEKTRRIDRVHSCGESNWFITQGNTK
uniref:DDE Tnp4 domain-containing protein n=1 Tax=Amphimedon queenslandica TaxID=400682 RepID=A0A1X7TGP3_AMPQE